MKLKTDLLVHPSAELSEKIRIELKEDVTTRDRDLAAIKDWLRKEPHLPNEWEDNPLMTFLRGSSFSLEKCKRKLDMYFTMRAACPEFFTNRDANSPDLREVLKNKLQGPPLPGLTPNGRRVTICRGLYPGLDSKQITDTFKLALMIGDIRLVEEVVGVAGDIYVLDGAVLGPSLLAKLSPSVIKKFMICVQEAYPVKLKEVHIINTSPVVERFVNFVKPFLKEKIRKRIFIHKELKDLYKYIPQEMLPNEYGGQCGSMDELQAKWTQKLIEYREWFKMQDSLIANESLRPGKPTNYDELFGIDGSFRQLAID
ncbi:alpha-tocopherol transfer protein-like isoform X2 [Pararge aegeria]|uniref:Jg13081 protein n=3 Tax=Pararge aegeria TaxID=116150 RepID=A0A8S4RM20_9NEOP|nr:alpha-tocopherol transfer protein-like isoform X2 [Pararge aegeria]XP_039751803.1 alpha-tocopherol transfer protein-like isoform X2 [Pararge aegeria]CAH2238444.1 jg13081 [Pararge aegeria aegeria]